MTEPNPSPPTTFALRKEWVVDLLHALVDSPTVAPNPAPSAPPGVHLKELGPWEWIGEFNQYRKSVLQVNERFYQVSEYREWKREGDVPTDSSSDWNVYKTEVRTVRPIEVRTVIYVG